jgi:RimJ/RimL family protein N-acetyltransferase
MPGVSGAPPDPVTIVTDRLVLRPFTDMDKEPFFELNTHPAVVESLGAAPSRAESDAIVDHIGAEIVRDGWGLWAIEVGRGAPFAGMVGLHRVRAELPCTPAVEVEWRLHPDHWGRGYATEGALESLRYGFDEAGLREVVSFTTTGNLRSQAVMRRIGMVRDPGADFDHPRLPVGSPLRPHVLYRIERSQWPSTVAS